MNEILNFSELCEELRVGKSTLYRMIHDGDGPPMFRLGRTMRFVRVDVDRWLAERKEKARR